MKDGSDTRVRAGTFALYLGQKQIVVTIARIIYNAVKLSA